MGRRDVIAIGGSLGAVAALKHLLANFRATSPPLYSSSYMSAHAEKIYSPRYSI